MQTYPPQTVFVKRVPSSFEDKDVKEAFEQAFGKVSSYRYVAPRDASFESGCAFIDFEQDESARRAAVQGDLRYKDFTFALEYAKSGPGSSKSSKTRRSRDEDEKTRDTFEKELWVGGLPLTVTSQTLKAHFSLYGPLYESPRVIFPKTNSQTPFAFIKFVKAEHAIACLKDTHTLLNKRVDVNESSQDRERSRKSPKHRSGDSPSDERVLPPNAYGYLDQAPSHAPVQPYPPPYPYPYPYPYPPPQAYYQAYYPPAPPPMQESYYPVQPPSYAPVVLPTTYFPQAPLDASVAPTSSSLLATIQALSQSGSLQALQYEIAKVTQPEPLV